MVLVLWLRFRVPWACLKVAMFRRCFGMPTSSRGHGASDLVKVVAVRGSSNGLAAISIIDFGAAGKVDFLFQNSLLRGELVFCKLRGWKWLRASIIVGTGRILGFSLVLWV